MSAPPLIAVMGPTASGKSQVAETLAEQLDAVILNADAFQIYRGMDIGTAKPAVRERYELLDLKNPDEDFGVGEYVLLASELLHTFFAEKRPVIICGGTGLYIRALLEEYKDLMPAPTVDLRQRIGQMPLDQAVAILLDTAPEIASKVDLKNEIRVKRAIEKLHSDSRPIEFTIPPFEIRKIAIIPPVDISQTKIMHRTKEMVQNGWVAEVNNLLTNGYKPGDPGFRALGYEAIAKFIKEGGEEDQLIKGIELDTVKYAKRQRTWLRAEPSLVVFSEISEALDAIGPQVARGN